MHQGYHPFCWKSILADLFQHGKRLDLSNAHPAAQYCLCKQQLLDAWDCWDPGHFFVWQKAPPALAPRVQGPPRCFAMALRSLGQPIGNQVDELGKFPWPAPMHLQSCSSTFPISGTPCLWFGCQALWYPVGSGSSRKCWCHGETPGSHALEAQPSAEDIVPCLWAGQIIEKIQAGLQLCPQIAKGLVTTFGRFQGDRKCSPTWSGHFQEFQSQFHFQHSHHGKLSEVRSAGTKGCQLHHISRCCCFQSNWRPMEPEVQKPCC